MKTQITIILFILFSLHAIAQVGTVFTSGGIKYKITAATTVEVTQNPTTITGAIVIPTTISYNSVNYQITSIGDSAFSSSRLTSVSLSNSTTSIGTSAFSNCTSLTSITIPNSITSIGSGAFYSCTSLTSITIPNSITSLSDGMFSNCLGLTSVIIPSSVTSIGEGAFGDCRSLTSITIPNAVTSLTYKVFRNCLKLTSITIPNTVTSIAAEAFYGCSGLTEITIPQSVTSIGDNAFQYCSGLTEVTVKWTSPLSISSNVFSDITSLVALSLHVPFGTEIAYKNALTWKDFSIPSFKYNDLNYNITSTTTVEVARNLSSKQDIVIPENVTFQGINYSVTKIGNNAFNGCYYLASVGIPNSITSIGFSAFYNCRILSSITIPNSVTSIDVVSFGNCFELKSISISNSLKSISDGLFSKCTALTSVIIPNSVTSIGKAVFTDCTSLTSVTIPNSVIRIGSSAFESCSSLTSVTIPNLITYIDEYTFKSCTSLTSVTLPNSLDIIGKDAFSSCTSLTSLTIPNLVTWIGDRAFTNCFSLTSVTFPNLLKSIGETAFSGCSALTSLILPNSLTNIGSSAFSSCSSLTSVIMSNSVTSILANTFYDCINLTSVTIPNSVKGIGNNAFYNCRSLTSINVPQAVTSIGNYAFKNCTSFTSVTVNWTTPLIVNSTVFDGLNLSSIKLNVPGNTQEVYKNSNVWKNFNPIMEMPVIGQQFVSNGFNYFVTKQTFPYEVLISGSENRNCVGSTIIPATVSNLENLFTVTSIGVEAFSGCTSLTSVSIPNSVTNIGGAAFYGCSGLTSITIPSSVTSINAGAFANCNGFTSVTLEWTNPLSISRNVFEELDLSTRTLNVPSGTATTYQSALVWKEFGTISEFVAPRIGQKIATNGVNFTVTKATLPYEVAVDVNTNSNSGRFTTAVQTGIAGELIIPATINNGGNSFSVTSIVANAFQNSTGLTSVTIPSSISAIGYFAFSNCTGLTSVNLNGITPIAINANVFENITLANVTLNVTAGTETAYKAATVWRDFKVETNLSTNSFSTNNALPFYPNPVQSQINFSEEINNLEVFDVAGRKVKSFQNSSYSFDVSNLVKGVYLLKGKTTEGKSSSQKMMKQ